MQDVTQADLDKLDWFHSIDFGNGVVSKGTKSVALIRAEADGIFKYGVAGKSVLDIGAWDGALSFEAEERGASDVLATDHFCWVGDGWGKKAAFDLAKTAKRSRVREMVIDVPDLSPDRVGTFDVVLFLGVLYHLKNPFLGLEKVASLAREVLVVETETMLNAMTKPVMKFLPGRELREDPTNWWVPNIACVKAMLNIIGFSKIEISHFPSRRALLRRRPTSRRIRLNMRRGRSYFHAFK